MTRLDPATESRSLDLLDPTFAKKLRKVIERCRSQNLDVRIATTLRGPEVQGRLWCRSRSEEEVSKRRQILLAAGAPTMASYLREEWAGFGPQMTSNLPGQSWHQWGQAADAFVVVADTSVWEGSLAKPVSEIAESVGLFHSNIRKEWRRKSRHWHVQLSKFETPLYVRDLCGSWADVEREMARRFWSNKSEQSTVSTSNL